MKVKLYPAQDDAIEIEGTQFNAPESVERFIRVLEVAKKAVWPPQPMPEKKK